MSVCEFCILPPRNRILRTNLQFCHFRNLTGLRVDVVAKLLSRETMTKNNYVTLSLYGEIPFYVYEGPVTCKPLTVQTRSQR